MNERELFQAAIQFSDDAERRAFLDQNCGTDAALRERLERLLQAHREASQFLESPAVQQLAAPVPEDATALLPKSVTTGQVSPAAEAEELGFLEPGTKPESLGRLGHYEVFEVLGRGAFGVVLKAFDEKLHRMVAIKVMNPELAATSPPRKRFLREAQSSAKVRHENIVAIHAVEEQPLPYLVMEYIPGGTLQHRLDLKGPLEITEILRVGQQIAAGLAAAHAQGLIHRDIKPANILIESGVEERVKITDFGLARATDDASLTQSGFIAGTPLYMAPEQAKGQTLDHRTDLFSLGSVLYTMASGRPPFRAANTIAVLKRVCEDTPRPINEIIQETPQWLCDIISKLHAKDPEDRFQSAKEVADLLGQHLAHLQSPMKIASPQPIHLPAKLAADTTQHNSRPAKKGWTSQGMLLAVIAGVVMIPVISIVLLVIAIAIPAYQRVRVQATQGELTVRSEDPSVSVLLDDRQLFGSGVLPNGMRLSPGTHTVDIMKGDQKLHRETITVVAREEHVVRWPIERLASQAEIAPSANQHYASDEWIDVLPLIDPAKDRWTVPGMTGKNVWGLEHGELSVTRDAKASKLILPIDSDWHAFEGEIEFTRRSGESGFNVNLPARTGDCPIVVDVPKLGGIALGSRQNSVHLSDVNHIENGKKSTLKFEVRGPTDAQSVTVWFDGVIAGTWKGPRHDLAYTYNEGYPHARRMSLWIHQGGNEFVFHKLRVRILDGGTASSLRPLPATETVPSPAIAPFDAVQARKHQEAWAKHLGVPVEYTNPIGMKFVLIPPGEFLMGATDDEMRQLSRDLEQANATEFDKFVARFAGPQHRVRLTQPYYLAAHEVTVGQYRTFIEASRHIPTMDQLDVKRFKWQDSAIEPNSEQRAVIGVSWEDAAAFCRWASQQHGLKYDLPTEAQWEHACRAGTTTMWSFGNDVSQLADYAVFGQKSFWPAEVVGTKKPNPFGLRDMHGNADEWCLDWHDSAFYATGPQDDPACLANPKDKNSGRVARGGTSLSVPWWTRSATRPWDFPSTPSNPKGFRPMLTVEGVRQASTQAPKPAIAPFDTAAAKAHQEAWAKHLGVPVEYTNSIGIKFRLVPAGECQVGSTPAEIADALTDAVDDAVWQAHIRSEGPPRKVVMPQPFYLGTTEVTQQQYQQVMGDNPSLFAASGMHAGKVAELDTREFPVEGVTWQDAMQFCRQLQDREQLTDAAAYSLPTEDRWEFACRAGTTSRFFLGDDDAHLDQVAWFGRNADARPHRTAELQANPFGLHDLHGNVWEWMADEWTLPADAPRELPAGQRVLRGGDWTSLPSSCRSAHRHADLPTARYGSVGFRVMLSVESVQRQLRAK